MITFARVIKQLQYGKYPIDYIQESHRLDTSASWRNVSATAASVRIQGMPCRHPRLPEVERKRKRRRPRCYWLSPYFAASRSALLVLARCAKAAPPPSWLPPSAPGCATPCWRGPPHRS